VVKVPLYENGKRVVKVAELAKTIKKTLIDQKPAQWAEQAAFTSAEFAVQMIEAPAKVKFSADFKT
jgi:hypothetical protein